MQCVEMAHVGAELLDGSGAESVASGDEDAEVVLHQPEADLGQIGRLADAVDSAKGHDVGPLLTLRLEHVAKDIDATARGQNLHQRIGQRRLHRARQALERSQHL